MLLRDADEVGSVLLVGSADDLGIISCTTAASLAAHMLCKHIQALAASLVFESNINVTQTHCLHSAVVVALVANRSMYNLTS